MAESAVADPWGEASSPAPSTEVDLAPEADVTYPCPHCGTDLTPHHDAVGSLHCYSTECNACCFLPPDETSDGKPRGKFEARPCNAARKASGF